MEFRTNLSDLLKSRSIKSFGQKQDDNGELNEWFIAKILPQNVKNYSSGDVLSNVIDKMGDASALAQGLHMPITSSSSFKSSNYILYFKIHGSKWLGLIKTGYKNLYVREYHSTGMINIKPLWILDFYVSENWQREGHGKHLFDWVLEDEKIEPKMLAYDRPSHKFLSFLNKHFGLWDYYPQNNNFVVFNEYFK